MVAAPRGVVPFDAAPVTVARLGRLRGNDLSMSRAAPLAFSGLRNCQ